MFRRLSWVVGSYLLFWAASFLPVIIVTTPELANSGLLSPSSNGLSTDSSASGIMLWLVATAMCFGVGFMFMRISGWVVTGMMPASRHRNARAEFTNDEQATDEIVVGAEDHFESSDDQYNDNLPSLSTDDLTDEPGLQAEELVEECAKAADLVPLPEARTEDQTMTVGVGVSEPRSPIRGNRPRVKIGRGARAGAVTGASNRSRGRRRHRDYRPLRSIESQPAALSR